MQTLQEPEAVFVGDEYTTESNMAVVGTWSLFDREQVKAMFTDGRTELLFYERWINDASGDGIVAYAMIGDGRDKCPLGHVHRAGELYFIMERYLDPVDKESFKQTSDRVERSELFLEEELRSEMKRVMEGRLLGSNHVVVEEAPSIYAALRPSGDPR